MDSITVTIDGSGRLRFVWSDSARELLMLGNGSIERASHVEPTADCRWTADLAPIGGPVLGPFETREEALTAEVDEVERRLCES